MFRNRVAMLAVIVIGCVVSMAAASSASAETKWLSTSAVNAGESVFTHYNTTWVRGKSVGSAAVCMGMRGLGDICGGEGEERKSPISEIGDEGYLHNHSTWESWFNAWSSP